MSGLRLLPAERLNVMSVVSGVELLCGHGLLC